MLEVSLVDVYGRIHAGRLVPGVDPVGVTFRVAGRGSPRTGVVLVTGGASGIGLAHAALAEGWRAVVLAGFCLIQSFTRPRTAVPLRIRAQGPPSGCLNVRSKRWPAMIFDRYSSRTAKRESAMKTGMSLSTYDIELDTDCCDVFNNAELTIILRLGFKQINPVGGAAEGTYKDYGDPAETSRKIIKWTKGAWELWKSEFVKSAQKYWHGKFWLINNFAELEFDGKGVKYRPNIWCRFNLIGADADKDAGHHTIEVVRLHPSVKFFGSHSRLYDTRDTMPTHKDNDSAGKKIMQQAHVHEIGHLIGLGHVDEGKAHCPAGGNTNAKPCYGVLDVDKNSVMGAGMRLSLTDSMPWRKAIRQLTGKGTTAGMTDWVPAFQRHYPRNPAEVAANRAIIIKPRR